MMHIRMKIKLDVLHSESYDIRIADCSLIIFLYDILLCNYIFYQQCLGVCLYVMYLGCIIYSIDRA